MTRQEVITQADSVRPGLRRHPGLSMWLRWLDDDIDRLALRYARAAGDVDAPPAQPSNPQSGQLPVPDVHARMYYHWLLAQYEQATSDYYAYANHMAAFNAAFSEYRQYLAAQSQQPGLSYSTSL